MNERLFVLQTEIWIATICDRYYTIQYSTWIQWS